MAGRLRYGLRMPSGLDASVDAHRVGAAGDVGRLDHALGYVNTYAPQPPYCTYGLRVSAACVLYVPEAQGSLPPGPHALYVRRTRTSLRCRTYHHVPWHHRRSGASWLRR